MPLATELLSTLGFKIGEKAVEEAVLNRQPLIRLLKCSSIYRSRRLRISFSELLSVKNGAKFLLIRNAKRPQQFGPIGGTVRYFPDAAGKLHGELSFSDEAVSGTDAGDLRGYIEGRHFGALLKWFNTGEGREIRALTREIQEELREVGLEKLLPSTIPFEFRLIRRVHEGPTKVRGRDYWQYRLFSVFRFYDHDEAAVRFMNELLSSASECKHLLLASIDEIKVGRSKTGELIGDHSGYLFSKNRVGVEPPPY
jgi:hypothetical protein